MPFFDDEFYRSRFHKEPEYLPWIFKWMMDRDFNYKNIADRRIMQVAMLILQTHGLSIAEYSWELFGPEKLYSDELQRDLREQSVQKVEPLNTDCMKLIKAIGEELKDKSEEYIEILGAIYYLCYHYGSRRQEKQETINKVAELLKIPVMDSELNINWDFENAWRASSRLIARRSI